jgi:hypothetical protein
MIYIFLIFFAYELWANWYLIVRQKQSPDHAKRTVLRTLVFVFTALIGTDSNYPQWVFIWLSFQLMFWFPFDVLLNLARGKYWNYQGKTAWLDRFTAPHAFVFWAIKFLLLIVGIIMYITFEH